MNQELRERGVAILRDAHGTDDQIVFAHGTVDDDGAAMLLGVEASQAFVVSVIYGLMQKTNISLSLLAGFCFQMEIDGEAVEKPYEGERPGQYEGEG